MANYKTADKLEILETVTENTYAIVEENGALKRVSGSMLGGGSKILRIRYTAPEEVAPTSLEEESTQVTSGDFTANMTYAEVIEALQNEELDNAFFTYDNRANGEPINTMTIVLFSPLDGDMPCLLLGTMEAPFFYWEDNTISFNPPTSPES